MTLTIDEKEAFLRLLDQHAGIIRKVAAGYSSSLADRHDLMQEISLQLWKAYPRYSPERPFSTWMYRIALNVAISFLRSNTRPVRQTVPLDEIDMADEAAASRETDERIPVLQRIIAAWTRSIARCCSFISTTTATAKSVPSSELPRQMSQPNSTGSNNVSAGT